ncbi:hypothetical protein FO519_007801 [Halicephalobus sp. NKZ332]|nr:hypothetical protein FO519_007801 [Halicephalobus sp. NKZ332]
MKADLMMQNLPSQLSSALLSQNNGADRRRVLAPRTSEEEALFIARKYLENKTILEAKLANAVNGGRFLRQNMLDVVANELSVKFNVANRNRKYVEQKLRDMKKEARKYLNMAKGIKVENGEVIKTIPRNPPEPIRVMMEAMAEDHLSFNGTESANWAELEFSDTTSKHEGSENEDEENAKSPGGANAESVASTSSSSSIDLGSIRNPVLDSIQNPVLGIDTILGAYFGQPMLAAMASFNSVQKNLDSSDSNQNEKNEDEEKQEDEEKSFTSGGKVSKKPNYGRLRRTRFILNGRRTRTDESTKKAAESFRRLCDSLFESLPKAAKSFEDACKLQSEYFRLQISLANFASQMQQINGFHLK